MKVIKPTHQPLASFQEYQHTFTQHLRNSTNALPAGIVKKRMAVYQEIVFNNLFQAVSSCFPVAQQVVGKRHWQKLIRLFFSTHSAKSPFFRDIPAEFLAFLTQTTEKSALNLPDFLISLCHYEWMELALTTRETQSKIDVIPIKTPNDLLNFNPAFITNMEVLAYEYAVHQISAKQRPRGKTPTYLLMYQNTEFVIKFIALNAVTYQLIKLLREENQTGKHALTKIAKSLQHPNPDEIIQFGLSILEEFSQQGLIIGVHLNSINQS